MQTAEALSLQMVGMCGWRKYVLPSLTVSSEGAKRGTTHTGRCVIRFCTVHVGWLSYRTDGRQ
eukprot:scaffold92971_cov19-Prasinocladus_malaysianus.AAC.1